jgi:hypothetical protein
MRASVRRSAARLSTMRRSAARGSAANGGGTRASHLLSAWQQRSRRRMAAGTGAGVDGADGADGSGGGGGGGGGDIRHTSAVPWESSQREELQQELQQESFTEGQSFLHQTGSSFSSEPAPAPDMQPPDPRFLRARGSVFKASDRRGSALLQMTSELQDMIGGVRTSMRRMSSSLRRRSSVGVLEAPTMAVQDAVVPFSESQTESPRNARTAEREPSASPGEGDGHAGGPPDAHGVS